MQNTATLEGGPFDGAVLKWQGETFPADVIISMPRKLETDTDDVLRGVTLHQYANCHSWNKNGIESHYMGHVASKAMTLSELNEMFPPNEPINDGE